ncbi:MAG: hypothetical protein HYX53_15460 [Chloroflexi bacterium]|nr:hypothetical protein [Chloroflexota bacterium]
MNKTLLGAAALLLAGGSWLAGTPGTALADSYCNGQLATIVVSGPNKTTNGTAGDDVIVGTSGADIINGQGGDDVICGGAGNDRLIGSDGDDQLFGQDGNDQLYGNDGDDLLVGGGNNDQLYGDAGNDFLSGDFFNPSEVEPTVNLLQSTDGPQSQSLALSEFDVPEEHGWNFGNDILRGNEGDDILVGGLGNDDLDGAAGDDTLIDFLGADKLRGGPDNDFLLAVLDANPDVDGETGDDVVMGIADCGANSLYFCTVANPVRLKGGYGNDVLIAHLIDGDLAMDGGYGDDLLMAHTVTGNAVLDGGSGSNDACMYHDIGGTVTTPRCEFP